MIRNITNFLTQHPEILLDDESQKKRKIDSQIENYVVKILFSENEYQTLNIKNHDPLTKRTFFDLMSAQKQKNLPYVLAMTQENDGSNVNYVDASSMLHLQKENLINNVGKIFFFTINFQETENDCFYYLGNSDESTEKKSFINTYIKASQNDPIAQFDLASFYGTSSLVNQDLKEAFKWFMHSANQGDADAERSVALCYIQGMGIEKNPSEAVKFFMRSANQGNIDAVSSLGICYYQGFGVNQNYSKAVKFFELSANQGHPEAQCNLAICYSLGNGVVQDFEKATFWFTLSANQGNVTAKTHLDYCDNHSENPGNQSKKKKYFDNA